MSLPWGRPAVGTWDSRVPLVKVGTAGLGTMRRTHMCQFCKAEILPQWKFTPHDGQVDRKELQAVKSLKVLSKMAFS